MILSIPALYFAYAVKPYIVISLIPVLGLIIVTNFNLKATTHALNYLIYPFFATAVLFGSWYLLQVAAESTGKYSFQNVATQAYLSYVDLTRHESYYHITMGGSVYDIGEFEPTIPGMLSKFPIAFYTGLFRPFLWEARKPIILLTSLEITAFSLFLLYGLLKYGVWRVLRGILENPWSIVFMIFSVFFIYMMGLTSGNFGNLVRYRVPGLFFFYTVIFATYGKLAREVDYRRQRK
ncbi:MAG: hypothetical protein RMK19_03790 [Bacteroidia bacterium]|nr:hypothetical protein [Bacteroidia bacterium]MDW8015113.1 hypothetical protein [Bacteroidia bacterium]